MSSKRRRSSYSPLRDQLRIDIILKNLFERSTITSSSLIQPVFEELNTQNLPCSSLKLVEIPTFEHLNIDMGQKEVEMKFFEDFCEGDELYARVFRVGYVELTLQLISTLSRYRRCFCRLRKFKFNVPFDATVQTYKIDDMVGVIIKSINLKEKQLELVLNEQAIFPTDIKPFYCSYQYPSLSNLKSYAENENIQKMLKNPYLDTSIKMNLDCESSAIASINSSIKNCRIENAKELKNMQTHKRLVDLITKASDFTRNGEYQMAISIFSKALSIDDKCADAYCGRGAANAGNKNFYGALCDLNKAIEIDPKHVNANKYRIAVTIAHAKNLENEETTKKEARKSYREAWEYSGKKNQEAFLGLKRLDKDLIPCINLCQEESDDFNGSTTSSSTRTPRKRAATQMALEDAKKLNDIESYIKSLKKK